MKDSLYVDVGRASCSAPRPARSRSGRWSRSRRRSRSSCRVASTGARPSTRRTCPVFHQVEGLAVDEGISFADLSGTLEAFAREMFGEAVRVRLTPDYFPFVEPGAQAAVSCFVCGGVGCRVCGNGWIELLGAGMVHPKVLRELRLRPRAVHGVRVRHGDRARRDGQVRRQRHADVRRGRRSVPRAVRGRGVKVVLSWLREFCPTDLSAEELAELLTRQGRRGRGDRAVRGRGLEVSWSPGSSRSATTRTRDNLCLARVQTGSGEREVVVGVRNMAPGDLVPYAPPGRARAGAARAAGGPRDPRRASPNGMLCSPESSGSRRRTRASSCSRTPRAGRRTSKRRSGWTTRSSTSRSTPNRPDLLSVLGVAREVGGGDRDPAVVPGHRVGGGRRSRPRASRRSRSRTWTVPAVPRADHPRRRATCRRRSRCRRGSRGRHAADLGGRRRDELRDARARAAAASVRPRAARRVPASWCAARERGRRS